MTGASRPHSGSAILLASLASIVVDSHDAWAGQSISK
jgi:hypothetical protein